MSICPYIKRPWSGDLSPGQGQELQPINKYSIGSDLRDLSRISKAGDQGNSVEEKADVILELVITCEMLKTTIFFAKEARAFENFKAFQHAAGLAVSLCKQSEGWLKSSRRGRNQQPHVNAGR